MRFVHAMLSSNLGRWDQRGIVSPRNGCRLVRRRSSHGESEMGEEERFLHFPPSLARQFKQGTNTRLLRARTSCHRTRQDSVASRLVSSLAMVHDAILPRALPSPCYAIPTHSTHPAPWYAMSFHAEPVTWKPSGEMWPHWRVGNHCRWDPPRQRKETDTTGEGPPHNMRVLVTGAGGALGRQLVEGLQQEHEVLAGFRTRKPEHARGRVVQFDLEEPTGIRQLLRDVGEVDAIVHCAAIARPKECEEDPEKARKINVPKQIVEALQESGREACLFIQISTDQVYEGTGTMYKEVDDTKPVNVYGKTKLEAEQYLRENWPNHVILRSSMIYGKAIQGVGFFTDFVQEALSTYAPGGQPTDFFEDEYRCPIYAPDIAAIISIVLRKNKEGTLHNRTFNMGGPQRLSRVDMACLIAEARGYSKEAIRCVRSASISRGVQSPLDISMDITRLREELGFTPTAFADALKSIYS